MANKIVNAVKKIKLGNANAKSVLRELADCANADGFCFPKYETIADVLEVSVKSIQRGMEFLEHNGWVIRTAKPKIQGKFVGFNYQINLTFLGLSDDDFLAEKPQDKLTDGQIDQWTECPTVDGSPQDNLSKINEKPQDNLTSGQFVHHNPNIEDLSLNPQSEEINQFGGGGGYAHAREEQPPPPNPVQTYFEIENAVEEISTFPNPAYQIWKKVFPDTALRKNQIEYLRDKIPKPDEAILRQVLMEWDANPKWAKDNVAGQISRYEKELKRVNDGKNQPNRFDKDAEFTRKLNESLNDPDFGFVTN